MGLVAEEMTESVVQMRPAISLLRLDLPTLWTSERHGAWIGSRLDITSATRKTRLMAVPVLPDDCRSPPRPLAGSGFAPGF